MWQLDHQLSHLMHPVCPDSTTFVGMHNMQNPGLLLAIAQF